MASFNLRLIGIILRDVLLREYPHFAITINFKMQPNCNFFYLLHYLSSELLPRPNLCYFYTYEISVSPFKFPFNLVCPLFLINLKIKQFKVHLWTNREGKHQLLWDTKTLLCFSCLRGPLLVDQLWPVECLQQFAVTRIVESPNTVKHG